MSPDEPIEDAAQTGEELDDMEEMHDMEDMGGMEDVPDPPEPDQPEPEEREAVSQVEFEEQTTRDAPNENFTFDLLMDVNLPVRVELGRTTMSVEELLEVGPGAVVELDKVAGEPAELYIRDTFFARGEVVVVDNNFGIRITDLSDRVEQIAERHA